MQLFAVVGDWRVEAGTAPGWAVTFCLRAKSNPKRAFNTSGGTLCVPSSLRSDNRRKSVWKRWLRHFAALVPGCLWSWVGRPMPVALLKKLIQRANQKSRSAGTPASREVARCAARAKRSAEHTSYENSDSRRLPERRAQRKASSAAGIEKRIFGDFLGKTKKLLRRRAELPASALNQTTEAS